MAARRINLLPPELAAKRRSRQQVAVLGVAGLALVALLAVVYVSQAIRLSSAENTLDAQEEANAGLRGEVAALGDFRELQEELETKTELVTDLTVNEVRWSVVLADISLVIPDEVWLTGFSASVTAGQPSEEDQPVEEPTTGPPTIGTISMSGNTFTHPDVAKWLTRLEDVRAFTLPYISLSAAEEGGLVTFSSTVELNSRALRRNQRGGMRSI